MSIKDQFYIWRELKNSIEICDDWALYTFNILILVNQLAFYGINYLPKGIWIAQSFNNLKADSSIIAVVYADNLSGYELATDKDTQSTYPLPIPCRINIDLSESISSDNNKKIIKNFTNIIII